MFSLDRLTNYMAYNLPEKLMSKTDCLNSFEHAQIGHNYCIFISLHRKKACIGKDAKCYTVTKLAMLTEMYMLL